MMTHFSQVLSLSYGEEKQHEAQAQKVSQSWLQLIKLHRSKIEKRD